MNCIWPAAGLVLVVCAAPAQADDFVRKGGEWRSVVSGLTPEPKTIEMCFLPATPEQVIAKMTKGQSCAKRDVKVTGTSVVVDLKCNDAEMLVTSKMIGENVYKGDVTLHVGAGAAARVVHYKVDAKWVGECKPGEVPY